MPRRSPIIPVALAVSLLASGCAAHEKVGRPPSSTELQRINDYAADHGALNVEYVTPLPACAGGACRGMLEDRGLPDEIATVVSSDASETVVTTVDGRKWNLRASDIAGVSARDRGQGALVGAAVGGGAGLALSVLMVALFSGGGGFPDAPVTSTKSDSGDGFKLIVLMTALGALGGVPWGYLIGGRRSFDFSAPVPRAAPGGDSSWDPQ